MSDSYFMHVLRATASMITLCRAIANLVIGMLMLVLVNIRSSPGLHRCAATAPPLSDSRLSGAPCLTAGSVAPPDSTALGRRTTPRPHCSPPV